MTREDIYRKLRITVAEVGQNKVLPAIIIGPYDFESPISGIPYLVCPTIGDVTLANTDFKTARIFEDA